MVGYGKGTAISAGRLVGNGGERVVYHRDDLMEKERFSIVSITHTTGRGFPD